MYSSALALPSILGACPPFERPSRGCLTWAEETTGYSLQGGAVGGGCSGWG